MVMTRSRLLRIIDHDRVLEAIRQAEKRTSGEIRISVSSLFWGDAEKAAQKAFGRMGMNATQERNAVLLFIAPARGQFVVWGDIGIHEKVGEQFWHDTVTIVEGKFRGGDFTEGLVAAIAAVGGQLALHFPFKAGDANELPDRLE